MEGIRRIRFMTSHPKDLSDGLIEVMKNSAKICPHLHLPVQSGSSRLLRLMNRHYTKESYLELVERLRAAIPDLSLSTDLIVENLPSERTYPFKSGVNIMFGCNNFCTYCIVPYVRGREKSREPREILREIEALAANGVVEVMLLGQNVNSYGKGLPREVTFAKLLREV